MMGPLAMKNNFVVNDNYKYKNNYNNNIFVNDQ